MANEFFDGTNLLNMKDKNGEKPELFIVCSRVRSAGKTYWFSRKLMRDFMKDGSKFVLFTRHSQDLGHIADGVFKEMMMNEFPDWSVVEKQGLKGTYSNVFIEKQEEKEVVTKHCGYVVSLNSSDKIKSISSMFVDAVQGFYDEFQTETGKYLPNEVDKFLSIHGSLARGGKNSRRYFPVYFASNTISITNDYFRELGLTNKLQDNTKKFRGDGFVYVKVENEELVERHSESGINRAFSANKSIDYADDSWLLDNNTGICKPDEWGKSIYLSTLILEGKKYGLHLYREYGVTYLSHSVDESDPNIFNLLIDGSPNPAIRNTRMFATIKKAVDMGTMRFDSLETKRVCLQVFC